MMEDVQHVAELGGTQMRVIGSNIAPFGHVYNDAFNYLFKIGIINHKTKIKT